MSITPSPDILNDAAGYDVPMAMAELADNAIEYTRMNEGERNIFISCDIKAKIMVIEDNGCGMNESQLHQWAILAVTGSNIKAATVPVYDSKVAEKKFMSSFFSLRMTCLFDNTF